MSEYIESCIKRMSLEDLFSYAEQLKGLMRIQIGAQTVHSQNPIKVASCEQEIKLLESLLTLTNKIILKHTNEITLEHTQ